MTEVTRKKVTARTLLRREVAAGIMLPRFYGIAYIDIMRNLRVCYPIPLNLLVRWARNAWWRFGAAGSDAAADVWEDGYRQGRADERNAQVNQ